MKKPPVVTPDEDVTVVGRAFGAPLVVKGRTWLPLTQVGAWALMTRLSGKPGRSWPCSEPSPRRSGTAWSRSSPWGSH